MHRPRSATPRRHPSTPRRLVSVLTAFAMSLMAILAIPVAATAAPNPGIVVGDVTIENTATPGQQLVVGDTVTVTGTWDATNANPQPGDTFTIGLPPELGFTELVPFTLEGDGVVWGTCLTDPATSLATCTLTDEVTERPE